MKFNVYWINIFLVICPTFLYIQLCQISIYPCADPQSDLFFKDVGFGNCF